jgi:regulator of protease activity HflC (stomatin/prohibitin superfamily)
MNIPYWAWAVAFFILFFLAGFRIIGQKRRGVVETFGKYTKSLEPGLCWVFPFVQTARSLNVTETMSQIEPQEIITKDNLNALVDLVVFYRIRSDAENVRNAFYQVDDVVSQIQVLSRTTARNVIGGMTFADVNSKRAVLNDELRSLLSAQTEKWGVDVVRVELKEITPPKVVQETMNQVIIAENAKRSAVDFATAKETEADGLRRAAIKAAEGTKQAAILEAEGRSAAFDLINKSFVGNAQLLRTLEVTENSLKNNAKIILTEKGISPTLILNDTSVADSALASVVKSRAG